MSWKLLVHTFSSFFVLDGEHVLSLFTLSWTNMEVLIWIFKNLWGHHILCWILPLLSWTYDIVITTLFMLLCTNSIICVISELLSYGLFSLFFMNSTFLLLCILGNFLIEYHTFWILSFDWIILYFYKYTWSLLWDAVNLLGNNLILSVIDLKMC